MSKITALVDMDLISYPLAAAMDDQPLDIVLWRAESIMEELVSKFKGDYLGFLTGKGNFRYLVDPNYKANRKDVPRPRHLQDIRDYLVNTWKAEVVDGYEADDAIGIYNSIYPDAAICSLDKDLDQLPGTHYNWKKNSIYTVSLFESLRHIFYQMLVGDTSDNIFGVRGIGPVRANKLLNNCSTIKEMQDLTEELYDNRERFEKNLRLITILTSLEEWEIVKIKYVNKQCEIEGEKSPEISEGQDPSEVPRID